MTPLFVALAVLVLTLLALLLWFVPHLLQQQAARVAGETKQLREMLLDLLNEQEAVTLRQTQLGSSLSLLRGQIEQLAKSAPGAPAHLSEAALHQLEQRLSDFQSEIQSWAEGQARTDARSVAQDNEAWANLMSLLAAIQQRVGELSTDRSSVLAAAQAHTLLEELEREMQHLRGISEDIEKLQWRLRRSLSEREVSVSHLRSHTREGAL
ncbi:MAG TPA: hypothetical protein VFS21_33125 [Roseiflexaceae bacterium]|nr:hypothetical protein [Roseiflexaceae bacterium]